MNSQSKHCVDARGLFVNKGCVLDRLPILDAVDAFCAALAQDGRVVLCAPPGAGKTTHIPLALHARNQIKGRILMLEPRRLAARGAAERMAQTLGEEVGQTVGYRMRGETKTSKATKIEVVTEGILIRMLQNDPELSGIGCVIFDEFHERALTTDLGLALCLEVQEALRDDLQLVVMSATLDAEPIARLMGDAPVVQSQGQSYPVTNIHRPRPLSKDTPLESAMAELTNQAWTETQGDILVFLPGEQDIRRLESRLTSSLPEAEIAPLYGALKFAEQRKAIEPHATKRKIVLATSIAETSLTITGITTVIDSGLSRRARFDPATGMTRLVTERASRAEARQRMGRAGRVQEGVCYKNWSKAEEGTLPAFPPAEIEVADLSGLVLELAAWGASPQDLKFLTPPPQAQYTEAQDLLATLGALQDGRITPHGAALAQLPLHPRLAHMLITCGKPAAAFAALLSDRDPLSRGAPIDLDLRAKLIRAPKTFSQDTGHMVNQTVWQRIRQEGKRLQSLAPDVSQEFSPAQMLAIAYPDRIGKRRKGDQPRYVLSGGKGAVMEASDPLGQSQFIVAPTLDGNPREAKIRLAAKISEAEIREIFDAQISWIESCHWSKRDMRVLATRKERLGAISLQDHTWKSAPKEMQVAAMLDAIGDLGLGLTERCERLLARLALAGDTMPDSTPDTLMATITTWLAPYIEGITTAAQWKAFDPYPALLARLDWAQQQELDRTVPEHFTTPLGRKIPIDYRSDPPEISLRLQEMFGQTQHPKVGQTPLRVTLLSPAGRPIQTTLDIPNFWKTSYADVRKDMRGQYPKHPWPEDPTQEDPTLRTKRKIARDGRT